MKNSVLFALAMTSMLVGCSNEQTEYPIITAHFDEIEKGHPVDCSSLVNASDFAGRAIHGEEIRADFFWYINQKNISIKDINQCQEEIEAHRQAVCSDTANTIFEVAKENKEKKALAAPGELILLSGYYIQDHISQICANEIDDANSKVLELI